MNSPQQKALKDQQHNLFIEYFTLLQKSNFAKELDKLCLASDSFNYSSSRLAKYEEQQKQDKKILQDLKQEHLYNQVEFYFTFIEFVKKYSKEDIRNASKQEK